MPEPTPSQKPVMQPKLGALTKRQQIDKSNKTIFIWVAVAGVVVSLAIVLMQFLIRQALFNQDVITQKQETSNRLTTNITNAVSLKRDVDALLVNTSLAQLRVREQDSSLQVIPDALPSVGDSVSFSNSLYTKILQRSGSAITNVTVGTPGGEVAVAVPAATPAGATTSVKGSLPTPIAVPFSFTATGSIQQVTQALLDADKTIRPIVVNQTKITSGGGGVLMLVVTGETYYLPSVNVELGKISVKP